MANTGNLINPYVTQVFTSGPNSGSEVNPTFVITFNSSSNYISESICGINYYYSIFDPISCPVAGFCVTPSIMFSNVSNCSSFDYNYDVRYNINSSSLNIPQSKIEYSLSNTFSGPTGSSLISNTGTTNFVTINISSGSGALSPLPMNQYSPVYFRVKNICDGSGESSYSSVLDAVCAPPSSYYTYDIQEGDLGCLGGEITIDGPVSRVVYSPSSILYIGTHLYHDSLFSFPVPYTWIKYGTTVYELSAGVIINVYPEGSPC